MQLYDKTYLKRSFLFTVKFCIHFCLSLFSAVLFGGYSTLGFSFEVEVAFIYFSYRSIWHPFVIIASFFHQCSCSFVFKVRLFSRIWWLPQCFQVSTFIFFSFAAQQVICRFQRTFSKLLKRTMSFFLFHIFSLILNRYTNQPASRVQFLCACRWHRKSIAIFLPFSVFNKYYWELSKHCTLIVLLKKPSIDGEIVEKTVCLLEINI